MTRHLLPLSNPQYLIQDHSQLLLSREWLVKVDSQTSTPYLFVCACSPFDLLFEITFRCARFLTEIHFLLSGSNGLRPRHRYQDHVGRG
jgi:hypothetical protein